MLSEIERFKRWLRRKAPHASTSIHFGNDLELFFIWLRKRSREVTVGDVDAFIEHSLQAGHALTTINRRLAAIRSFYHFLAVESDEAPKNPVIPKRHFIRIGQRLPRDLQDDDVERLFAVIRSPRDRAMFLLMLRCGLRVGEIHQLSMNDLYLYPILGSLPRLRVHGKGSRERIVYLSKQAQTGLEHWLEVRPVVADQAVFLNRFGRRIAINGIQERIAHYCRSAGLWVTCHQLRHTFGRHLTEARVPLTSIQRLLGHARLRTTEIYLHISDKQVQADYESAMAVIAHRLALEGGE
jgi:site-specific recombinase XerD